LQNDQWITEEIKEEINKILESNEKWEHNLQESLRYIKSSAKKKVYTMSTYIRKERPQINT
jgi:hypothetical protein